MGLGVAEPAAEGEQAEPAPAEIPPPVCKEEDGGGGEEQAEGEAAGEPAPQAPRFPAAAFRGPGAHAGIFESPVLLPMLQVRRSNPAAPPQPICLNLGLPACLQQVEPSPSTSMLAAYPMPLIHPGGRLPYYPGLEEGLCNNFPWLYPKNYIAPSRNRQVGAGCAG
jgi:hypothetical protein